METRFFSIMADDDSEQSTSIPIALAVPFVAPGAPAWMFDIVFPEIVYVPAEFERSSIPY